MLNPSDLITTIITKAGIKSPIEGFVLTPILGGNLLGWAPFKLISVVVWLLSLYSLYILFVMVRKRERFAWSLGLLILGTLFYLVTIFY